MNTAVNRRIRRGGIALSLTVNAVVVALAVWLALDGFFVVADAYIIQPQYDRLVSQFDELPVRPGETVFLGDSLTEFGAWEDLFPGAPVRNRGVSGDRTAGVLARLQQVTDGQPGQVFVMIGTNDLTAGVPEDEILANVQTIVTRIHDQSPDTEIFVQSVLPRGRRYRQRVESLNRRLEAAVVDQATWIDLYQHFLDDDGSIADAFSNDELHLFGNGYLVWRNHIQRHVTRTSS